ncbi:AI-2E family transporter [Timonella senegalensis]|uniref:AI-2E family transporter n=1 Tax=Timonella senegalensis TaxID=1465825 RepID=UPI0028AD4A53|nr:AI-2E family transporter [Timonella senegalensis]
MSKPEHSGSRPSLPQTLQSLGALSWSALGIIILVLLAASALSALSGILVPLVVAVLLGALFTPVYSRLRQWNLSSRLATVCTMVAVLLMIAGVAAIVVVGLLGQAPEIARQFALGWNALASWLHELELPDEFIVQLRETLYSFAPHVGQGMLGVVTRTLMGATSLAIGAFFALFFLFFVIKDSALFPRWVAHQSGLEETLVENTYALSQRSLLQYFRGTALTALITAPIFILPLVILRVPLVLPIFILYFFLSFIPYVGAWLTGAFAIVVALGSGGTTAALIVALSLLISNGTIQSVVSSWALGSSLRLHPISVLLATIVGGTVAGILGMILGPPLLAIYRDARRLVRQSQNQALHTPTGSGPHLT